MPKMPVSFHQLSTPLPPMLCGMAGVCSDVQFVGFYYLGSKPYWTDGRAGATFPFYSVWQPFVDHRAIVFPLAQLGIQNWVLGSDDSEATHLLLGDRQNEGLYLAPEAEGKSFLRQQHPPAQAPTPGERAAVKALIQALPAPTLTELRQQGMFEWMGYLTGQVTNEELKQRQQLTRWLDRHIPICPSWAGTLTSETPSRGKGYRPTMETMSVQSSDCLSTSYQNTSKTMESDRR